MSSLTPPPRLALVGDRSDAVQAHARIPAMLAAMSAPGQDALEPYWIPTGAVEGPGDVTGFDGVWVVPGSPYDSMEGVLIAIEAARVGGIPLLGTCGGFQHIIIEFARNVCGLSGVTHAEVDPTAPELMIVPLSCDMFGEESEVWIEPGTRAAAAMGEGMSTERYFCRYGVARSYEAALTDGGLVISGRDAGGEARVVELPGHPFLIGTLFQPELSSDATWIHPLIRAFGQAVRARAGATAAAL